MDKSSSTLTLALGFALAAAPSMLAGPAFLSSRIEGPGTDIIFCDLDGDRLKDAVLVDGLNLAIYYQDATRGFSPKPNQVHRRDNHPAVVWPAKLGEKFESLLVMTSEGVTQLDFTNRANPAVSRQIIRQRTVIPELLEGAPTMHFGLSAATGTGWPLLLLPVAGGLQVWRHDAEWRQVQFLEHAADDQLAATVANPGYSKSYTLIIGLNDVNGDGRADLMELHNDIAGMDKFALYLQQPDGRFSDRPVLTHTNKSDRHTTHNWIDLNRDGHVDLIKSTAMDEASFIPGVRSGKVLVTTHVADAEGRIPAAPSQVFRKNDWSAAIPVVDVDGDGFVDLVLGYIPLSTREGVRKIATAQEFDINLKFHFYRPGTGFPATADCERDLAIHFDREFFTAAGTERGMYYEQFFNLQGDFNGDGKRDLLVKDHAGALSVYYFLSREKGFSAKADLKFNSPDPIAWIEVADLNGDGVSDVVMKQQRKDAFQIFTSQGK